MRTWMFLAAAPILALAASPAAAHESRHNRQHDRLEYRHDRGHERLEDRHDRAHDYGMTRREHRRLHHRLEDRHYADHDRLDRRHDRSHWSVRRYRGW